MNSSKRRIHRFFCNFCLRRKAYIGEDAIDILILDICLPDAIGLDLVKEYKSRYQKMDVIIISGFGDMDLCIRLCDWVLWIFSGSHYGRTISGQRLNDA